MIATVSAGSCLKFCIHLSIKIYGYVSNLFLYATGLTVMSLSLSKDPDRCYVESQPIYFL